MWLVLHTPHLVPIPTFEMAPPVSNHPAVEIGDGGAGAG